MSISQLTRFERARLISARALQLSFGAPPLVKGSADLTSIEMSSLEFDKRVLPLSILRRFPSGETHRIEL
ncbi:MAG: DNA-directed RNA polymerase subunit K [archaeon]|nr:DNA-directed RNA polymerase subunit K [archaeon]